MQDPDAIPQRLFSHGMEAWPAAAAPSPGWRSHAMRRRILVFLSVFLLCAGASLSYNFMRPAIYLANARVQVTPAGKAAPGELAALPDREGAAAFLFELQVLTSRPLLEKVAQRLWGEGRPGEDAVQSLQNMLTVQSVDASNVVLLEARGPEPQALSRLLNTVLDVYRHQQEQAGHSQSAAQLLEARDELRIVDAKVAEQKKATEAFRLRSNIVSLEREENQVLSRLKELGISLGASTEREAIAEGKLRALEQAARDGTRAVQARDNPTLADIEQRLSLWREEWRALERQYTPEYLDMDPPAKALKIRIANLEQQLAAEQQKSQQNALANAREELASARAGGQRLQQQLSSDKQSVQVFARNFAEFKSMQEALESLEKIQQAARQRLLTLESREMARQPQLRVIEPAATPESPWRPLYARDAAIGLAASLGLAFLAVWFVEFFNRPEPPAAAPQAVMISQPWMAVPHPDALARLSAGQSPSPHLETPRQLAQAVPRELEAHEVARLLAAATPETRPVLVALLCGLGSAELAALRAGHVDKTAMALRVPGDAARVLPLDGPLLEWLPDGGESGDPLFSNPQGAALTPEDIQSLVTSSAYDADLEHAASITPEALRYTYIAHLVRQGLRFGELARVVGRLSADTLNALAPLAPAGERVAWEQVERWLPAVRDLRRRLFAAG